MNNKEVITHKGSNVVVLNEKDYIEKMSEILRDDTKFVLVKFERKLWPVV